MNKSLRQQKQEILRKFFSKDYYCYMTGFIAGMPFLGDIDKEIRLNRLETPRVKVPKGAVGITEKFCNIYTFESPGGWNIVGNTIKYLEIPENTRKCQKILENTRTSWKILENIRKQ